MKYFENENILFISSIYYQDDWEYPSSFYGVYIYFKDMRTVGSL